MPPGPRDSWKEKDTGPQDISMAQMVSSIELLMSKHEQEEKRNASLFKYFLVPLLTALLGGTAFGGWKLTKVQDATGQPSASEAVRAVSEKVTESASSTEAKVEVLEKKVQVLGEVQVAHEVTAVDSFSHLEELLRAPPSQRRRIEKPESLKKAEERVEKLKRKKAVDKLFREFDPDDPLAEGK